MKEEIRQNGETLLWAEGLEPGPVALWCDERFVKRCEIRLPGKEVRRG